MRQYEVTFIVDPVLSGDEIKTAANTYSNLLKDEGCDLVHVENNGLKQLAYTIKKRNSGVYHTIEFTTENGAVIPKLELSLRRDERIIRFLTVHLDKYAIKYNDDKRKGLIGKKERVVKDNDDAKKKDNKNQSNGKAAAAAKKEATPAPEPKKEEQVAPPVEVKADTPEPVVEEKVEVETPAVKEATPEVEAKVEEKVEEVKAEKVEEVKEIKEEQVAVAEETKTTVTETVTTNVAAGAASESVTTRTTIKGLDDLTKIEGIGPKVVELLNAGGIITFNGLSQATDDRLGKILQEAGAPYSGMTYTSWAEQAKLASQEKWDELKTLQDKLVGGK